ncbi:MAG TPA: flagellar FlbD family protein, partial [Silvibacterium sp.]|nr:flagellar FlbD family protein [Silvibacterium sp.]
RIKGYQAMIELTRLNGSSLVVNSDLIQFAEAAPDTTLTLVNGEKVVVRESTTAVIDLTIAYRARVMGEAARHYPGGAVPGADAPLRAPAGDESEQRKDKIESNTNYISRRRRTQS